jgi:hypothetical protein
MGYGGFGYRIRGRPGSFGCSAATREALGLFAHSCCETASPIRWFLVFTIFLKSKFMLYDEACHRRLFSRGWITGCLSLRKFWRNVNVGHFDGFVGHFELF